jgi:hypothetical protein
MASCSSTPTGVSAVTTAGRHAHTTSGTCTRRRDPNSRISKVLSKERVTVLKKMFATYPHVFYIGLDMDVADPLMGYEECVSCYEMRPGPTVERLKRSLFPWK